MAPAKLFAIKNPISKIGDAMSAIGTSISHQFENRLPKARTTTV